jgi:two-component system, sensor histidine kinase ChiS
MDGNTKPRSDPARILQNLAAGIVLSTVLAGAAAILVFVADRTPAAAPRAAGGVIDVGRWDFARSGPIGLRGVWSFAPGAFVGPDGYLGMAPDAGPGTGLIEVPGDWRRSPEGGTAMTGPYGHASYALAILRKPGQGGLALLVPDQAIAWELYVDGRFEASNGVPAETEAATRIRRETLLVPLPDGEERTSIYMRVSNFSYDVGGLINPIQIGPARTLSIRMGAMSVLNGFLLGGILVISLYHFFLFMLRIDDKSSLYFSVFCFLIMLRTFAIGHYPERLVAGRAIFELSVRIEYLCFYMGMPVYLAFVRNLYPEESHCRVVQASFAIGIAFSAVVILVPPASFMAWTTKPYQALTVAASIYALVAFARALSKGRIGAIYGLVGFAFFFLVMLNDMLHADLVIRTAHLSPLGLMVFMLADSLIVSSRIASIFDREKLLAIELAEEKRLLDRRIEERTAELTATNERLRAMDRAKSRFLATVSHELRTPISLIVSPVEQVVRGRHGDSIPRDGEIFARLLRSGYRMLNIIEGMFDFARLELGRLSPRPERADLARTLAFYASELDSLAQKKGVTLRFEDGPGGRREISVDPRLFEIALFNVLTNAIKFTPPGGSVTISATGPEPDGRAAIAIRDTGIGIGPELLPRIFSKLDWQADETERLYDGAGIGLSLSKKIIELHGGEIRAASAPGEGSTFTILLPIAEAEAEADRAEAGAAPTAIGKRGKAILGGSLEGPSPHEGAAEAGRGPSILLVEDSSELLEFTREALASSFRVHAAADGEEALGALRDGLKPDIVVTDVMMPRLDGSALFREAKALLGEDCPPFVFLTARNDPEERLETLAEGAVDYLGKPFDVDELSSKIASLLAMRERASRSTRQDIKEALGRFLENSGELRAPVVPEAPSRREAILERLTRREAEIAERASKGMPDKEIAAELGLASRTVSNTLLRIYRKAGVENRLELIRLLG